MQTQLDLDLKYQFSETSKAARWARLANYRKDAIVIAFPTHLPYGVALELLDAGLEADRSHSEGWFHDQAPHYYAVLMRGRPEVVERLLAETKRPPSHGSRTPGNFLPW